MWSWAPDIWPSGRVTAFGVLLVLEIRNVPVLRRLDARRYQSRFRDDNDPPGPLRGRRG